MNFNIENSLKLQILNKTKPLIEISLYEELLHNGFDPEIFDHETFIPDENIPRHETLVVLIEKYKNIVNKINELKG